VRKHAIQIIKAFTVLSLFTSPFVVLSHLANMPQSYSKVSQDEEKLLHNSEASDSRISLGLERSQLPSLMDRVSRCSTALHWVAHGLTILLLLILLVGLRRDTIENEELYSEH
jgi:hypothetical protein